MTKRQQRDTEPPPICRRCGGSGAIPVIPHGPYVEEGDVREEYPLQMCPECLGTTTPVRAEADAGET